MLKPKHLEIEEMKGNCAMPNIESEPRQLLGQPAKDRTHDKRERNAETNANRRLGRGIRDISHCNLDWCDHSQKKK